ncbi:MAG: 3-deoxy-D-manno-octulosonic acid transferase [Planctomycetes bacterium]|nr:3-deoxy-D-manno-octulosonic acid transferase [Planctomycetota bacterium]
MLPYLLNLIYLGAWLVLLPWLWFRRKPMRGLGAKWFGRTEPEAQARDDRPVAWFHGVSVGEIHLLRQVVARFRQRFPDWHCVISTTTNTGHDEACKHFADLTVIYWPFDFTWAVTAALDAIRPTLVVLSEGEVWPNFVWAAKKRGVKLALINARMSPRSARRFRFFRWLLKSVFGRLDWIGAQSDEYRQHYLDLGAVNVVTTGNIKYDGVNVDRGNAKTQAMRTLLGIPSDTLVWVAGSTQDPEESAALDIYRRAKSNHPNLRLILVPRHPERFDDVSNLLDRSGFPFIRRSAFVVRAARLHDHGAGAPPAPREDAIILIDTIGELSAVWGLADIAFVGGSLDGKRGGQNMIEPSAYGAAVLFGPHTWNFKQTVADLLARDAAIETTDVAALETAIGKLLDDASRRQQLGQAARAFVLSQQGATGRTLDELQRLMNIAEPSKLAA